MSNPDSMGLLEEGTHYLGEIWGLFNLENGGPSHD